MKIWTIGNNLNNFENFSRKFNKNLHKNLNFQTKFKYIRKSIFIEALIFYYLPIIDIFWNTQRPLV